MTFYILYIQKKEKIQKIYVCLPPKSRKNEKNYN